ncbi:glycosyltransferase family 2 protein [Tropicimonas isoalkanivorans]|uniref:Glycosyltransferase n=1 Tax=Tropicimonas isoalkanivorans TaxID=441112 RepID=A0A1I1EJ32_9RHOB|nr:glycosyltransferase family 2 protein [Tropicimonas isoalkanivorans]SFB86696.1 glycosyltransferase [Tropicimonas isoalkanivorans]
MKFSIITATFNRESTVADAIASLQSQTYGDFEHLVQDGASRDATMDVVRATADGRTRAVSEPDAGIYDALNKAIDRATGDAVGLLHSDDMYASDKVLEWVAAAFADPDVDAVYGDLHYVQKNNPGKVVRNWKAGAFTPDRLRAGWMPPHPTLFLRRSVLERLGAYDTSFTIAADYDAVIRYFAEPGFTAVYVPEVFVKMRAGGESNRSLESIVRKSREDYRALRRNGVGGLGVLARKNISKLEQFVVKDFPRA